MSVVAGQNQPSVLVLQPVEETPAGKARIVPIWIGPTEAAQIGMALEHVKFARPMTHVHPGVSNVCISRFSHIEREDTVTEGEIIHILIKRILLVPFAACRVRFGNRKNFP